MTRPSCLRSVQLEHPTLLCSSGSAKGVCTHGLIPLSSIPCGSEVLSCFHAVEAVPPSGDISSWSWKLAHELSKFRNLREMSIRSQAVRTNGERVGHPSTELPVRHAESPSNAAFVSGQPY